MPLGESRLVGELGSPLEKSDSNTNVPLLVERQCEPAEACWRISEGSAAASGTAAQTPPRSSTVSRPSAW